MGTLTERSLRSYIDNAKESGELDDLRPIGLEEIRYAMRLGLIVNQFDETGEPVGIRSDELYSGAFLERALPTARLDASLLREALSTIDDVDARGLRLHRVIIDGPIDLNWLTAPFAIGFEGCVLSGISMDRFSARLLSFDSCLFIGPRSAVDASGTHIEADVRFFGCEGLQQLFLVDSQIGSLELRPDSFPRDETLRMRVVLSGTRIETLSIDGSEGVESVAAIGSPNRIEIGRLILHLPERPAEDARAHEWISAWLRRGAAGSHAPQVWEQFARALDESADAGEATELRIEAERDRSQTRPWFRRALDSVLDVTTGFFYKNTRALWWLLGCWIAITAVTIAAFDDVYALNAAAGAPNADPGFRVAWSLVFAANTAIIPLDLGFAALWPSSVGLVAAFGLLKLLSIILFGLFIAGATGLVNRGR
ncbi:hypothetical protein [Microbacterium memoriense]|uniref:Pentapeptide repeat-containing protein n=1 Tax=Microbacterium memoriense TaxID=2978350 RepID=A0ABT2PDM3_9MICO|nr:hypothetical protein [Microbacterium memoriense]MCT9002530.1 hypothetical protein [Microbacterium memoriense]